MYLFIHFQICYKDGCFQNYIKLFIIIINQWYIKVAFIVGHKPEYLIEQILVPQE